MKLSDLGDIIESYFEVNKGNKLFETFKMHHDIKQLLKFYLKHLPDQKDDLELNYSQLLELSVILAKANPHVRISANKTLGDFLSLLLNALKENSRLTLAHIEMRWAIMHSLSAANLITKEIVDFILIPNNEFYINNIASAFHILGRAGLPITDYQNVVLANPAIAIHFANIYSYVKRAKISTSEIDGFISAEESSITSLSSLFKKLYEADLLTSAVIKEIKIHFTKIESLSNILTLMKDNGCLTAKNLSFVLKNLTNPYYVDFVAKALPLWKIYSKDLIPEVSTIILQNAKLNSPIVAANHLKSVEPYPFGITEFLYHCVDGPSKSNQGERDEVWLKSLAVIVSNLNYTNEIDAAARRGLFKSDFRAIIFDQMHLAGRIALIWNQLALISDNKFRSEFQQFILSNLDKIDYINNEIASISAILTEGLLKLFHKSMHNPELTAHDFIEAMHPPQYFSQSSKTITQEVDITAYLNKLSSIESDFIYYLLGKVSCSQVSDLIGYEDLERAEACLNAVSPDSFWHKFALKLRWQMSLKPCNANNKSLEETVETLKLTVALKDSDVECVTYLRRLSFFVQERTALEKNRHGNPILQQAYDFNFGIVPTNR